MGKLDRRSVRTQTLIKETFIELLSEKSFEKITVRDITDRADINRGTFYIHYVDKYDLLQKYEEEIFIKLIQSIEQYITPQTTIYTMVEQRFPILLSILYIFKEEAAFLKVILSSNGDAHFIEKIRQIFLQYVTPYLIQTLEQDKLNFQIDILITYLSSAHLGVVINWLQQDMPQQPEEIADILTSIMLKGPLESLGIHSMLPK